MAVNASRGLDFRPDACVVGDFDGLAAVEQGLREL